MKTAKTTHHTHDTHSTHPAHATPAAAPTTEHASASTTAPAPPAPSTPAKPPVVAIPTEDQVTQWVNALEGVRAMLGEAATPLTIQERRRALRIKKGGEATIGLMVGLGQQYRVQLPGIDPAQIQQLSLLVTRLQPLETKLRVISGLVSDTVAHAKTESWQGTTALYTALTRTSKRNPDLQKELKPAVQFFKQARGASGTPRASRAKGGAAPATSATPPPTAAPATVAPSAPAAEPSVSAAPAAPGVTKQ